jgi:two-component system sensor histidine kinase/response regulator
MSDQPDPIDATVFAALVDMTGGEMDFVDELVDTYLDDGRKQVDLMLAAVAGDDSATLGRAAHSLKSGSLNVGAVALGSLCRALEEGARSGPVPDAAERVAAIATGFAAAGQALLDARVARSS